MKRPSEWIRNRFKNRGPWFLDGDEFLIAVLVRNNKTGSEKWEFAHVRANCDGESFRLEYCNSGESYDGWDWFDVDYYIKVNAVGPLTRKQIEDYL